MLQQHCTFGTPDFEVKFADKEYVTGLRAVPAEASTARTVAHVNLLPKQAAP
jgi:hypothetical protein